MDIKVLIATALGRPIGTDEAIAVGVSGGPDSLALLTLCVATLPGRVTALTVDHGLRAGSAAEAAGVAHQCGQRGIPHQTLVWDGPKPRANVQAAARAARYELMGAWCAAHDVPLLLTAHHADDQAETLLMRLNRASGVGGLSGIRSSYRLCHGVTVVRPLLGQRRAVLGHVAAAAGWTVTDDPSNRDDRFDRSAARKRLAQDGWLDAEALARSAAHLAAAEDALAWVAARVWAGNVRRDGAALSFDPAGLPEEVLLRVTRRIIAELSAAASPRGDQMARLVARLGSGGTATLAGVRGRGGRLWRFDRVKPHRKTP